ncbi:MAG: FAD-dependent oxidoreductase [Clostridia bacterium]|nr:FAD-dependent oxidoreductase [Clostridia bacterium]
MNSIWNSAQKLKFDEMGADIKTDVLIIGGGMCGILCAYMLNDAGVDCVLVEASEICSGTTGKTTAKITLQHGLIYSKIIDKYGTDAAQLYYHSQRSAFDKMCALASKIDDDFNWCDSFVYSLNDRTVIEREIGAMQKIGCDATFTRKTELPFDIAGAVKVKNQAQFHPIKFINAIASNLKIYENTKVLEFGGNYVKTNRGKIYAKKIIVATHFPLFNKHGAYFAKMYQHRSYVLALKNAQKISGMYVDEDKKGLSFRGYNNLLLLGGGSHRTGKKGGNWQELKIVADKYYPHAHEVAKWATQDCMTLDDMPYIGRYSKTTPNLYVATGFNKWGMTSSMLSAMMLRDMICERENEYTKLYSPSRSVLHMQLAINLFETTKNLFTFTKPRCPHLGCALKYNKQERSWDCPCHGSRFDSDGKLLDNPATDDIVLD